MSGSEKNKSIHSNHRKRLDRKVEEFGIEMLEQHEQLEWLLFSVIPLGDTNEMAHKLLERFVTIAGVLNADPDELKEIAGIGKRAAMFLTQLPAMLGIVERSMVDSPVCFKVREERERFMKSFFHGKLTESAYMFCLNSSYRLLGVKRLNDGGTGEIAVNPIQVAKTAMRDCASAVVVAHNHPCGSLNPSVNDIHVTRILMGIFDTLGIEFCDSIIVAGEDICSLRQRGYMADGLKRPRPVFEPADE